MVDDTIVEGLYRLLQDDQPGAIGFESTTLRFHKSMRMYIRFKDQSIAHIYHNGSAHFVAAVQTCDEYVEFADSIYGLKPGPPSPKVLDQMRLNFSCRDKKGRLVIRSHCVQKQSIGNLDCGLYAAFNILVLLRHLDPGKYKVDEKTLRPEILKSFCFSKWQVQASRLKKPRGPYCIYRM